MDKLLNLDTVRIICKNLDIHDMINLNCTCSSIHNILHELYHECCEEIEREWNKYANIFINDHKNPYKLDVYEQDFYLECSILSNRYHYLKVKYYYLLLIKDDNKEILVSRNKN